jgi:hypothetical protein
MFRITPIGGMDPEECQYIDSIFHLIANELTRHIESEFECAHLLSLLERCHAVVEQQLYEQGQKKFRRNSAA